MIILLSILIMFIIFGIVQYYFLKRKCYYINMIKSEKLIPYKVGNWWSIKFISGRIFGIIPVYVIWHKEQHKTKYIVTNTKLWVTNKIKEICN